MLGGCFSIVDLKSIPVKIDQKLLLIIRGKAGWEKLYGHNIKTTFTLKAPKTRSAVFWRVFGK